MQILFSKIHANAELPIRANPSDAGADIKFYAADGKDIVIKAGESIKLATGLKVAIPHGFMLQVMNRSGVASKKVLKVGAHVVDPGYTGEIFVNMHNDGLDEQVIKHGDKVAQLVLLPVINFIPKEVPETELLQYPMYISGRKDGGFGSSGR